MATRPKILQIVEVIQSMGVVFVALAVVGWAAFYVQACHAGFVIRLASYVAIFAALLLLALATKLGFNLARIFGEGHSTCFVVTLEAVVFVLVLSTCMVLGQFALDQWSYRLDDCSNAVGFELQASSKMEG
ncbi:hypothetical protein [Celeribacter sp. ULVN23_4]